MSAYCQQERSASVDPHQRGGEMPSSPRLGAGWCLRECTQDRHPYTGRTIAGPETAGDLEQQPGDPTGYRVLCMVEVAVPVKDASRGQPDILAAGSDPLLGSRARSRDRWARQAPRRPAARAPRAKRRFTTRFGRKHGYEGAAARGPGRRG